MLCITYSLRVWPEMFKQLQQLMMLLNPPFICAKSAFVLPIIFPNRALAFWKTSYSEAHQCNKLPAKALFPFLPAFGLFPATLPNTSNQCCSCTKGLCILMFARDPGSVSYRGICTIATLLIRKALLTFTSILS